MGKIVEWAQSLFRQNNLPDFQDCLYWQLFSSFANLGKKPWTHFKYIANLPFTSVVLAFSSLSMCVTAGTAELVTLRCLTLISVL